ncbi:SUR7/PalI family-domain-containing protein [Xylogone sp. PMI_703]|nr:SUR7/PalI family-domain-containing protein [Xylogone sp. PMI_703]
MARGGRVVCIAFPYLLTIGALIALIFVGIGSTHKDSDTLNKIYFMRADLSSISSTESTDAGDRLLSIAQDAINGKNSSAALAAELDLAEQDAEIKDFYNIGLFGYCSGDKKGKDFEVTFCSKPKAAFWFNPVNVWHLNTTSMPDLLPKNLRDELNTYKKFSYWMFISYVLAFAGLAIELLVGIAAIFSRWGSVATAVFAIFSKVMVLAASITATAIYATLVGTFNTALKPYGVKSSLGGHILAATWLAVLLSGISTAFWLFSACCVSGRSDRVKSKGGYEAVSHPYGSGPAPAVRGPTVPVVSTGPNLTAYEPYRHQ